MGLDEKSLKNTGAIDSIWFYIFFVVNRAEVCRRFSIKYFSKRSNQLMNLHDFTEKHVHILVNVFFLI